jgi:hypothetical protein
MVLGTTFRKPLLELTARNKLTAGKEIIMGGLSVQSVAIVRYNA